MKNNSSEYTPLNLIGGDNRGYVYDDGVTINRIANAAETGHAKLTFELYQKYALAKFGIVKTEFITETNTLKHEKLQITYPHEWPPALLKDAVLFHLQLLLQLNRYNLTLKDALPENILFTGISPTFIDFFSLVTVDGLANEEWLKFSCPDGVDLRIHVLNQMFVPYMLLPLLMYATKNYNKGKLLLKNCYCNNCQGQAASWDSIKQALFPSFKQAIKSITSPGNLFELWKLKKIHRLCDINQDIPWEQRIQELQRHVETLDVMPPTSGYVGYYAPKGEDTGFGEPENWNEKQCGVAKVLAQYSPKTVLDIGANTGWFSLLSATMGAYTTALDIDLSSIDALYRTSKQSFPNTIKPLWMSFDELSTESYSQDAAGNMQKHPVHMAATKRLQSDVVLCLGLIHHLTLGMGMPIEDILHTLLTLTKQALVLEFVDLSDKLITENPGFFPALSQWNSANYSQDIIKTIAHNSGFSCAIMPSSPTQSRSLLILEKLS